MVELVVCKKDSYFDSVTLMTLSSKLKKLPGVGDAVVSMATTMNKELLENVGMLKGEAVDAGPNDLVVAIRAESQEQCDAAYGKIDELLHSTAEPQGSSEAPARTIREAKERNPDLGVAIVSVKGEFAAREARIALQNDMHVMLFSDNVSVEQERELKALAHEKGLLVMGPDCGTAILGGVGLCFANKMRQGSIGLAAASGTGLQEVCVLIDKLGEGISQALGTGGRDLSAEIGGMMMLDCIDLLDADPDTKVIVVVSKPPVEEVANKVRERLARCSKPVVVCFIAGKRQDDALDADEGAGMTFASSLEDAAYRAVALARGEALASAEGTRFALDASLVATEASRLGSGQRYLRALYCGGTLAAETLHECSKHMGELTSNVAKDPAMKVADPFVSSGNCIIDLGDDVFTAGRPHPMIEPGLRCERILQEAADPACAVMLLDFELGYGSNPDPVGVTLPAIEQARALCRDAGRDIVFVGYVQGTDGDDQGKAQQRALLTGAGVVLAESNLHAVSLALAIMKEREAR